jgi:hypothetical protein
MARRQLRGTRQMVTAWVTRAGRPSSPFVKPISAGAMLKCMSPNGYAKRFRENID